MKYSSFIYIITFIVFFTIISALYLYFFVYDGILLSKKSREELQIISKRKTSLVKGRLSYTNLNELDPNSRDFFSNLAAELNNLEAYFQESKDFYNSRESDLIPGEVLNNDKEVNARGAEQFSKILALYQKWEKILAYNPEEELYPLAKTNNYDLMLGAFRETKEGLEVYRNYAEATEELEAVFGSLDKLENAFNEEKYEYAQEDISSYLVNYERLKKKAYLEIKDLVQSEQSVELLVDWSNLILEYDRHSVE